MLMLSCHSWLSAVMSWNYSSGGANAGCRPSRHRNPSVGWVGKPAWSAHAGTSSPSQALRGAGPHVSRVSAASIADGMQYGRKESYAKNSRPTLGTHSKLLRALSGAASGQVPCPCIVQLHEMPVALACASCQGFC